MTTWPCPGRSHCRWKGYVPCLNPTLRHTHSRSSGLIAAVPAVASSALPSPFLEGQVWLAVEASRLLREAQPMLEAEHVSTAAQEVPRLVQGLLHVLLGELAAGADARVAAIDGVFATLLSAPATPAAPVQRSADDAAMLEAMCRLHRDLVALSLGWEELLDLVLPTAGGWSGAPGTPANASAPQVSPLLTPLPSGVVVTQPGSGGGAGRQYPGVREYLLLGLRLVARLARIHILSIPPAVRERIAAGKGSMSGC